MTENLLGKSFIKVSPILWVSFLYMIFMFFNGAAVDAVIKEVSSMDLTSFLHYSKQHILHIALIGISIFLVITANKKLLLSFAAVMGLFLFEMISNVFLNFDKYIIFNIFIFFTISYYFFHLLKGELNASYYIKNYSDDLLRSDFLLTLSGKMNESETFVFTITNWDINGFFAKADQLPDSFDQVEIQYKDIKIVLQSVQVYYFDKNKKCFGCKVNDPTWKSFVSKLESFGVRPEYIR